MDGFRTVVAPRHERWSSGSGPIFTSLRDAQRRYTEWLEVACARFDLAPSDAQLILFLRRVGPCPIGRLRKVLGQKPSTLTSVVDRLADRRLLMRKANTVDRRSVLVGLTGEGRAVADQLEAQVVRLEETVIGHLEHSHLEGFRAVLEALAEATDVPPQVPHGRPFPRR